MILKRIHLHWPGVNKFRYLKKYWLQKAVYQFARSGVSVPSLEKYWASETVNEFEGITLLVPDPDQTPSKISSNANVIPIEHASASWFMPETTSIQIVLASRQCTRSDDDIQSAQINCRPFDSASYGIGWAHALTSYVANIVFIMAGAIDTRYLANQKNVSPTLYWSNHLQFSSNKPFMVKTPALGNMVGEWMPEFCGHLAAHSMLLLLGFRKFFTVSPLVSYLNPWWSSMMFQSVSNSIPILFQLDSSSIPAQFKSESKSKMLTIKMYQLKQNAAHVFRIMFQFVFCNVLVADL